MAQSRNRWLVRLPLTLGERQRVRDAAARIRSLRGGRYGISDYVAECIRRCLTIDCKRLDLATLPTGREHSDITAEP